MNSESGTIDAGGFTLQYLIEGSGPPTIVIGSALYYPRVFSQQLREHLRLVFLDHRGFCSGSGDYRSRFFQAGNCGRRY